MTGRSYSRTSAILATIGGSLPIDTKTPVMQSAHSLLFLDSRYILQLRDDKPNIAAPGQWSLFGGLIQNGETPHQAIIREILEELSIQPPRYEFLWHIDYIAEYEKEMIRSWFFEADVSMIWSAHILREGKATGVFAHKETMNLAMPWVMRETIDRYKKRKHLAKESIIATDAKRDLT